MYICSIILLKPKILLNRHDRLVKIVSVLKTKMNIFFAADLSALHFLTLSLTVRCGSVLAAVIKPFVFLIPRELDLISDQK